MKIYSDVLLTADFTTALPGSAFYFEHLRPLEKVRLRQRGWEVLMGRAGSRRTFNSGQFGAEGQGAASWDEWGTFLAALYEKDPEMRAGPYKSRADFHRETSRKYVPWSPPVRHG
jgi:hypothetical protein